ncbi:Alpha,alpha-trehalose-phosphate synthase [UDP-forming] 6 [Acorus calamus]|uniref:Alpha,alpha-trehalose-phosphate synthase [UDP-forming] 6 n=1 Tax=Acorus calamus TaxID=4465 RepID=A0AAV9EPA5_ACOCL|nr:Alpha,alpha-trehalose-phosphate synthase [UDP-forming] 6 [Acorus calamus]
MTTPGILSDPLEDADDAASSTSDTTSHRDRLIIVSNQLPIITRRDCSSSNNNDWSFSWDHDSLLLQLRDRLVSDDNVNVDVVYVGCLRQEVPLSDQESVSQSLWDSFNCVPTFLPQDIHSRFYHGFCKQQLWPLFHYMLPLSPDLGGRFDRSLWQAYVSANKIFADRILEVISPDEDLVWVHDYHLMVLPTFLRKRFNRVKLGFFLHSPFPSSEIYKTLPVREEILRSLLNADLIGFHTFDYARHFLSCCSRMLGLSYESKRGYIGVSADRAVPRAGLTVMLGVDDMDIFKGISLKLLAMEQFLIQHPEWRGKVVLVQIANPARGRGRDVEEVIAETHAAVHRINAAFGGPGYEPIVLIDTPLQFYERVAYYVVAECCLVTAVRDGMNLIPYEYIISRQGNARLDEVVLGLKKSDGGGGGDGGGDDRRKKSVLVVSEFIGCSPSLSGAIRVNPWNVDAVAEAMAGALEMGEVEKRARHEKHHRYVSTHDVGYWARSFLQDLRRACTVHETRRCWGIGFGLGFRVVALDPSFRKLSPEHAVSSYRRANARAILLDYDGTLMPQASIDKGPSARSIEVLNALCADKNNLVFLFMSAEC